MNHFLKSSLFFGMITLLLSCGSKSIPKELDLENNSKNSIESCSVQKQYTDLAQENEDILNAYLNLAGFAYHQQDYRDSNKLFDKAINKYRYFENKDDIESQKNLFTVN